MTSCVGTVANPEEEVHCFRWWLMWLLLLLVFCCCCSSLLLYYFFWRKRQAKQPYTWVENLKVHRRKLTTYEVKAEQESKSCEAITPLDIDLSHTLKPLPPPSEEVVVSIQQKTISMDSS